MRPAAVFVHHSSRNCLLSFALEQEVQSFFFVTDGVLRETTNVDLTLRIVLNRDAGAAGGITRLVGKQVVHLLIVDLEVTDFDFKFAIGMRSYLLECLSDGSGDDASVLEVGRGPVHGEGLTGAGLAVAHDCSVVAIDDLLDDVLSAVGEDVLL